MALFSHHPLLRASRRSVIWLLAVALLVYGQSAALVQLLGPAHRHETSLGSAGEGIVDRIDAVFRDIRAWRAELHHRWLPESLPHAHADGSFHTHGHTHDGAALRSQGALQAHSHATYQRHHHSANDATVVMLDGSNGETVADTASQAAAGSANLPMALAPSWTVPRPGARWVAWMAHPADRWCDAFLRLWERPPRR